jgi:hypothetical protein
MPSASQIDITGKDARKLVKNGAMTRTSSVAFHLPDRNAMKYASG